MTTRRIRGAPKGAGWISGVRLEPEFGVCSPMARHCSDQSIGRSAATAAADFETEFRPFSRVLGLKSPASLSPQNSVSRITRWRGRRGG